MAIDKLKTTSIEDDAVTSAKIAPGTITDSDINSAGIGIAKLTAFNTTIAPEVLEINVDAPGPGADTHWLWTWETSSLPYARVNITNQQQSVVPIYKQGSYQVNNHVSVVVCFYCQIFNCDLSTHCTVITTLIVQRVWSIAWYSKC
jgi:hypothetical protein